MPSHDLSLFPHIHNFAYGGLGRIGPHIHAYAELYILGY